MTRKAKEGGARNMDEHASMTRGQEANHALSPFKPESKSGSNKGNKTLPLTDKNEFFCHHKRCQNHEEKKHDKSTRLFEVKRWKIKGSRGNYMWTALLECPKCGKRTKKCVDKGRDLD